MPKIFISYSSKDRPLVEELAADLELLLDDAVIWYDRELNRSGGHQWWNLILEEIRRCDVFIYALSPQVLKSEPCRREYGYARALGKPVLPLHMADVEIRYLPLELQAVQLVDFRTRSHEQRRSLKTSIRNLPAAPALPDLLPAPPEAPLDPVGVLFDRITRLGGDPDEQRLLIVKIEDLAEEDAYQKFIPELLERLINRDDVLTVRSMKLAHQLKIRLTGTGAAPLPAPQVNRRATDLLPAPFAWIHIPAGYGTMMTNEIAVNLAVPDQPYNIGKYPVTNAQFAKFIEDGGYSIQKWWTDAGWAWLEKDSWTQPRLWEDTEWNGAEQPVVGVSWYEAVAFCLWLSDLTGERIMLPTEAQWQYAAQGDDGRAYPWGNEWDGTRCNNGVGRNRIGYITPVRQYEGKGESPFGVVDMAGNVWEWCLTDYKDESNNVNSNAKTRVLRGGYWDDHNSDEFRCGFRSLDNPPNRGNGWGFRLSLS